MVKSLTLKAKILIILLQIVVSLSAVTAVVVYAINHSQFLVEDFEKTQVKLLLLTRENRDRFFDFVSRVEIAATIGDREKITEAEYNIKEIKSNFEKIAKLKPDTFGVDIDKAAKSVERYRFLANQFADISMNPSIDTLKSFQMATTVNEASTEAQDYLRLMHNRSNDFFKKQVKNSAQKNNQSARLSILLAALVVALLTLSISISFRTIIARISRLTKHFSDTDLNQLTPLAEDGYHDEIADLLRTSNAMLINMKASRAKLVQQEFVEAIFAALENIVIVTNRKGRILTYNPVTEAKIATNLSKNFFIFDLVSKSKSYDSDIAHLRKALANNHSATIQMMANNGNDNEMTVLMNAICTNLKVGEEDQVVIFSFSDMSDVLDAQQQKELAQKQLVHAAKLASLGTLGAGIAHELNNPLAAVKGYAEILFKNLNESNPKLGGFAAKIIRNAERMAKIINHLRVYAADTSAQPVSPIEVIEPIENALSLLENQLTSHGIVVHRDFPDDSYKVLADSSELESVIQNLIVNSRDAFDEFKDLQRQKQIDIRLFGQNDQVVIQISDNAGGMPEETKNRIFDPFFTTKDVGKGTGLGLSISYNIVKDANGQIECKSSAGSGTTFTITLPLLSSEDLNKFANNIANQSSNSSHILNPRDYSKRYKLLVVDDDEDMIDFLDSFLANDFDVTCVNSGRDALKEVSATEFDAVISDMKMPEMNGFELLAQVKVQKPQLPFIIITGHATTEIEVAEAKALGADQIIGKPLPTIENFRETVRKTIHDRAQDAQNDHKIPA